MRLRYVPIVLLFVCLASAFSQTATKDPNALAVIQQCRATIGQRPVSDTLSVGTITDRNGKGQAIEIRTSGLSQIRVATSAAERSSVSVISNDTGFLTVNDKRINLPGHTTKNRGIDHIPSFSVLAQAEDESMNVRLIGEEEFEGRKTFHIKFDRGNAPSKEETVLSQEEQAVASTERTVTSEVHVFIDAQAFVPIRIWRYMFAPDNITNRSIDEMVFSDFRVVEGTIVPFKLTRRIDGRPSSQITWQQVSFNVQNLQSDFQ